MEKVECCIEIQRCPDRKQSERQSNDQRREQRAPADQPALIPKQPAAQGQKERSRNARSA
jgi:hypothetical protein